MSISGDEVLNTTAMTNSMVPAQQTVLLNDVADGLRFYGTPVIVLFGTFGNVMTIVIMRRMTSSSESTVNVYFTSLAAVDLVYLYSLITATYAKNLHAAACVLSIWGANAASTISAWVLVCLTLHRAAAVAWPHKVGLILTHRRVIIVIASIAMSLSLLNSFIFFSGDLVEVPVINNNAGGQGERQANLSVSSVGSNSSINFGEPDVIRMCIFKPEYEEAHKIYSLAYTTVYSIIPFAFLVLGNVILIWKLIASVKDTAMTLTSGDQTEARRKSTSSVTLTVVLVSTAFVLLTLPYCILWAVTVAGFKFSFLAYAQMYLVNVIFTLLSNLNHAINFYLYCLPGRRFRQEFLNIICCTKSGNTTSGGLKSANSEKTTRQTGVSA